MKPTVRPTLHRYFLTVVVDALKACGAPTEIGKLGKHRQGPLMVTLAWELTAVTTNLLIRSLMFGQHHDSLSRLVGTYGGERLEVLQQRLGELQTIRQLLEQKLQHIERSIINHALGEISHTGRDKSASIESPFGGIVVWTNDPPRRKELAIVRKEYEIVVSKWRALEAESGRTRRSIGQIVAKVKRSQEYLAGRRDLLTTKRAKRWKSDPLLTEEVAENSPGVSFQSSGSLLNDGPANYLRNTDRDWWREFTRLVEQTVAEDLKAPACMMLCDPNLWEAAKNTKERLDETMVSIMAKPNAVTSLKWPKTSISAARVRSLRTEQKKADEKTVGWLRSMAGNAHPCYLAIFETECHATLEQSSDYPFERAYNELCWCLSRKDSAYFPFKGIYSRSYTRDEWDSHVRTGLRDVRGYWSSK